MKNFLIVGKGICGKATGIILHDNVDYHDPPKKEVVDDTSNYCFAFICVPTEITPSGTYDYTNVDEAVKQLKTTGFKGLIVIRSTCDPAYLQYLQDVYGSLVYWPEFLREAHFEHDATNPENVVIGGTVEYTSVLVTLLKKQKHSSLCFWKSTDIVSASIIKLGLNSALAAKIAMFNSIKQVCEIQGADWETVRSTISNDSRIGNGQTMVPGHDKLRGFGGKCLPKDLSMFSKLAKENVYLDSIIQYNNKIRN